MNEDHGGFCERERDCPPAGFVDKKILMKMLMEMAVESEELVIWRSDWPAEPVRLSNK